MSIHKSLVVSSKLKRDRNVLKKTERIGILESKGQWKEGDSIYKLPKVAPLFRVKKSKGADKKAEKKDEKAGKSAK